MKQKKASNTKATPVKSKGFSVKHLLLCIVIGVLSTLLIVAIAIAVSKGTYQINWTYIFLYFVGFVCLSLFNANQQTKNKGNQNTPPANPHYSPVSPNPNNPKPFTPRSFEEVREFVEVERSTKKVTRLSAKEYLELSHQDKPRETVRKTKPKTAAIPYQVFELLNGDKSTALRLYEGIASRYTDKGEVWIWGKVISDLERDRQ